MTQEQTKEGPSLYDNKYYRVLKTKLYARRWWIAGLIALQDAVTRMVANTFGLNNDVFVAYFRISYATVDWFTIGRLPSSFIACGLLAWFAFRGTVGFRKFSIFSAFCASLACAFLNITMIFPMLYPLIVLGELLLGVTISFATAIPTAFATLWFPEDQIGIAIALTPMGGRFGSLMAALVSSHLLHPPCNITRKVTAVTCEVSTSQDKVGCLENWFTVDRRNVLITFGILFLISIFILVVLFILAADKPILPPTLAQVLQAEEMTRHKQSKRTFEQFIFECKDWIFDRFIVQVCVALSVIFGITILQMVLISEVLRCIYSHKDLAVSNNVMSSYIIFCYEFWAIVGALVSGKLTNHFQNLVKVSTIAAVFIFLSSLALVLGYLLRNLPVLFISDSILGFSSTLCTVQLLHLFTEHTYPKDVTFITALFTCVTSILSIVFLEMSRILKLFVGGLAVLVYQTACSFLLTILISFMKPNYSRREAEQSQNPVSKETDKLITCN